MTPRTGVVPSGWLRLTGEMVPGRLLTLLDRVDRAGIAHNDHDAVRAMWERVIKNRPVIRLQTRFFGDRWDSPRVDHATQVRTPDGELCLHCNEPIEFGDRGLMMSVVLGPSEERDWNVVERPAHMECDLRSTLSHIYRQCRCFVQHPDLRTEARATLDAINVERARHGMGPM